MPNLNTVQQDIAELTPEAQQIIFTLIDLLKKTASTYPSSKKHLSKTCRKWLNWLCRS